MNLPILTKLIKHSATIYFRSPNITSKSAPIQKCFSTTNASWDMMEFFDIKKNWAEENIRVGRSWRLDELRIKSNSDLHKLWYVLLKERNMLLTMEHEFLRAMRSFPNPERIDKVKESMDNIEKVVKERNIAYYELETGETGERPVEEVVNLLGLKENYEKKEYHIPKTMNTRWVQTYFNHGFINSCAVKKFYRLYREKQYNEGRKARNRDFSHVQHLLKRFPQMDMDALKAEYPNVDIEKAKRTSKVRGHYTPIY